jgi:CubicO group peptidase (beta-lactamase class C family)
VLPREAREGARRRLVPFAIALGLSSGSCIYARIFYYNVPNLDAPQYFDSRAVRASPTPLPLSKSDVEETPALTESERTTYATFDAMLERNDTRAFVELRDDTIVYERYFDGVTATTALPSFSISKTFAALLVGCAVGDSIVESLDASVVDYIPELAKKRRYDEVTLDEMLRMTSGIDFDEESTSSAKLYYCTNLRQRIYQYPVRWNPGEHYEYGSVSIQLLWDVLHRRLGGETVSQYFEERVWSPLGAERPAAWALDSAKSGVEKFFSGFSATARDHARLGLLYLHGGTFEGKRIVSQAWVDDSLTPDPVAGIVHTSDGYVRRGKYQWFLTLDGRAFFAKGYHGQYVFVVPDRRAVFVRFGEGYGNVDWPALFERIADAP